MTERPTYEPRIFGGRVLLPEEIERIHEEILGFEKIEAVSDPMRELIEDLWPELAYKLPHKEAAGEGEDRARAMAMTDAQRRWLYVLAAAVAGGGAAFLAVWWLGW
jgi:ferric-dicitrate binding protein FerR (iron transport regulator)